MGFTDMTTEAYKLSPIVPIVSEEIILQTLWDLTNSKLMSF